MEPVSLIICGGFHPPEATQHLVADISRYPACDRLSIHIHPEATAGDPLAPLAVRPLRQTLEQTSGPVLFLAFSAGCIAAVSAACYWHYHAGQVLALFAVDGWGVPLEAPFPVHRLSHDRFTHITSASSRGSHFYADPPVDHLQLWQRPSQAPGIAIPSQTTTAAEFLNHWMGHYCHQHP